MRNLLARVAGWGVERPAAVIAATALLVLLGAVGALSLEADAGTGQLVDEGSPAHEATERFKEEFGDDAVVVLVKGDLEKLLLTPRLNTLLSLEGCLSGNAPGGRVFPDQPAPETCAAIAEANPARVVYGPATFLNQFAAQAERLLGEQAQVVEQEAAAAGARAAAEARRDGLSEEAQREAASAAADQVVREFVAGLYSISSRYGNIGLPRIDDPEFVRRVVFDSRTEGQPKSRFAYLFPSADAALISIRLEPGLSGSERGEAIDLVRDAVTDPTFSIAGAEYVVGGVPVLVEDLAGTLESEIFLLLGIALAVMALALLSLVRPPLRLLPLGIALGSAALTFGGLAAVGGTLTLAALAVLPVLIGLSVDYAIQFQARFGELRAAGASPARAAVEAAARSGPVIGAAALATAAGFAVLLFWPIPVIRTFGLLLLAGIGFAYVLTLITGLTVLSLTPQAVPPARVSARLRESRLAGRVAGARRALADRGRAVSRRAVGASMVGSGRLLAVAAVIAIAGWALGTRTDVGADVRELLPGDLQALEDVEELERGTGVSGEIDVLVTAEDIASPAVVEWMGDYKARVLERAGFTEDAATCIEQDARLCPSIALPDLFGGEDRLTRDRIQGVLDLLPAYFSQAVISTDPETGEIGESAVIAFGIKVMPFDEQKELVDAIRAEIDPPGSENDLPAGASAEVVGLPVLVADASSSLDRDRYLLTLGGLVAVALALLLLYRSPRRALVPLLPIFLATGWSAAAVWALGIELNPMSATLGALVIAIATEFSVLLTARFEEERAGDVTVGEALRRAYATTGGAVLASGLTATAGFAVLAVSAIPLLRDFGLVTVIDLVIALVGVLVILPATVVWAERGFAPFGAVAGRLRGRRERPSTA